MIDDRDITEVAELIARQFGVTWPEDGSPPAGDRLAALSRLLAVQVLGHLRDDLNRLTNLLYRMDVPEHHVERAFEQSSLEDVAARLAEAIVRRSLRTVTLRRELDEGEDS